MKEITEFKPDCCQRFGNRINLQFIGGKFIDGIKENVETLIHWNKLVANKFFRANCLVKRYHLFLREVNMLYHMLKLAIVKHI